MSLKLKVIGIIVIVFLLLGLFLYFRYFFTYEQKNIVQKRLENIIGQNLTITVFGYDGRIIKRWYNVNKLSTGKGTRNYTFFYTKDNRFVQLPASVWYIAEEEK
jgi:hypothetical protein